MKTKIFLALAAIVFSTAPAFAQVVTSGTNISVGTSTVSGTQNTTNTRSLDITGVVDITQLGVTASASGNFSAAELNSDYNSSFTDQILATSNVIPTSGTPTGNAQSGTTFESLLGTGLDYTLSQSSSAIVTGGAFNTTSTNNGVSVFGGL